MRFSNINIQFLFQIYKEKFSHLTKLKVDQAQFKAQRDALIAEFEPIKEKKEATEKKLAKQKQIIEAKVKKAIYLKYIYLFFY